MSITLVDKLEQYARSISFQDDWKEVVEQIIQKKEISHELFKQLVGQSSEDSLTTNEQCLSFCRKLLILALIYRNSLVAYPKIEEDLAFLYVKLIRYGCLKQQQLIYIYKMLIFFLLENEIEQADLQSISCSTQDRSVCLPHSLENVEFAIIAFLFGIFTGKKELIEKATAISLWQMKFLEDGQSFPEGLWTQAKDYSEASLSMAHTLLFYLTSQLHGKLDANHLVQESLKSFNSSAQIENSDSFYVFIFAFALNYMEIQIQSKVEVDKVLKLEEEKSLGYGKYQLQDMQFHCAASGVGSGFATLHKNNISIVSMGPQLTSLAEMNSYGIYRAPLTRLTCFKDVSIEQETFQGWTRMVAEDAIKPGSSWIYIDLHQKNNRYHLKTRWVDFQKTPDVFLVFFVKALKVVVDKKYHLNPSTLDRYQGKKASVTFCHEKESLTLESLTDTFMQVIPLAGGDHFWGAKFLLAYAFPKNQELAFDIF